MTVICAAAHDVIYRKRTVDLYSYNYSLRLRAYTTQEMKLVEKTVEFYPNFMILVIKY